MNKSLVPLGGKYDGVYGALFCRKCSAFLGFRNNGSLLPVKCPSCETQIDYKHKLRFVNGEWKKVGLNNE